MAKGFSISGSDFDVLFEAPYTNFNTTTFTGLNPTCTYCTRYFGDNPNGGTYFYSRNGTKFDASPRGFLPSNYKVATITTTGKWMKIQRESTGFSVTVNNSTTTYRNSNRGSYPINRVGLLFCGGGAGGGNGSADLTWYSDTYGEAHWDAGHGGGGGATIGVTLWLDKYTYYLYIGKGGYSDSIGGASYLRLTSSSGTLLATANGGNYSSGGTATINNSNYFTLLGSAKGGNGGQGGGVSTYSFNTEWSEDYADGAYSPLLGNASGTFSGYYSQNVSGARINDVSARTGKTGNEYTWYTMSGDSYEMGQGPAGRSALSNSYGCGGCGGDAGISSDSWGSMSTYYNNGDSGSDGVAFFYY